MIIFASESPKETEYEILHQIIDLTWDKIRSLLERLHKPHIRAAAEKAISGMREDDAFLGGIEGTGFQDWIRELPVLISLGANAKPSQLITHIKWASQARWVYSEHIEALFCPNEEELPDWINWIYKIGRYYAATKNLLKLSIKQPALFTAIHIEPVEAPERQHFSVMNDKNALKTVLQKLTKADPEQLMSQLGIYWRRDDPELCFRQACRLELTVHAEMQLLSFYDHYPEHPPRPLFMGTSKKACFLCHRFMSRHPLAMSLSASHQKLYPSWMPAPCSSAVRKVHKVLLWELSRHLEQTTARDLQTRLGVRRPKNLDSTAGPSLPTTESIVSGWLVGELPSHARTDIGSNTGSDPKSPSP